MPKQFQSTPSLRKVTRLSVTINVSARKFQSTPSLRKVTHVRAGHDEHTQFQSTPSLRKVTISVSPRQVTVLFQSTPSLRKVTPFFHRDLTSIYISIHTFLAEGDGSRMSVWRAIPNFNPHLPRGR